MSNERVVKTYSMNNDNNTFDMMEGFLERVIEPTIIHAQKELKIGPYTEETKEE